MLAEKIRNVEITSLEATETYIEHLQKINPVLNCLVEERFEQARSEAQAVSYTHLDVYKRQA